MAGLAGWYTALGVTTAFALWNSQRPGEMTDERDRIYRECLSGRVPVDKMREIAAAFEKARCFPQCKMIRKRIALKELPATIQEERKQIFQRAMVSKNKQAILDVARAFEEEGATTSAAKLRRRANSLPDPMKADPIVTPPPNKPEQVESQVSDVSQPEIIDVSDVRHSVMNGSSHVVKTETVVVERPS